MNHDQVEELSRIPTSFSSLPFELRQQIWLYTFQPRILCLYIHQHVTPPAIDKNGEEAKSNRTISVAFHCTVASTYPSVIFQDYARRLATRGGREDGRMGTLPFEPSSAPPAALYVCHESRQLALKRYEPAFGRVDVDVAPDFFLHEKGWKVRWIASDREWKQRRIGTKQIWVDFERDVIVVDTMRRPGIIESEHMPIDPLGLIRTFAKEHAAKIQNLSLGGSQIPVRGYIMGAIAGDRRPAVSGIHNGSNEWLTGFDSLKNLLPDNTFDLQSPQYSLLRNLNPENVSGQAGERIHAGLTNIKRSHRLEWKVPAVKMMTEKQWDRYLVPCNT